MLRVLYCDQPTVACHVTGFVLPCAMSDPRLAQLYLLYGPKDAHEKNMYMIQCKILNCLQGYNQDYSLYICNHDCWVCLSRPKTVQTYYIGRGLIMYIFLWHVFEAYCNIRKLIFI